VAEKASGNESIEVLMNERGSEQADFELARRKRTTGVLGSYYPQGLTTQKGVMGWMRKKPEDIYSTTSTEEDTLLYTTGNFKRVGNSLTLQSHLLWKI
jgi:hypothetical protein